MGKIVQPSNDTIRCPYCIDGVWYRNSEFKEPYGYPYRPQTIRCEVCNGSKAILKTMENCRPDLEKITEKERIKILKKINQKN